MKASGGFCPICQDAYQVLHWNHHLVNLIDCNQALSGIVCVYYSTITFQSNNSPILRNQLCFTASTYFAKSVSPPGLTGTPHVPCAGQMSEHFPSILDLIELMKVFQDEVDLANEEGDWNKESHEDHHRVGWVVLQQHCPDYRNLCSAQVKILNCLGDEVALVNILILLSDWEAMIIS